MPRSSRESSEGSCHHVFNRGISRRPIFDGEIDRRLFLSLLAGQVEQGRLVLHAYCLLDNHYHLLVETPTGELDIAMREITRPYVRIFNRAHKRDGTLFRSRFKSKLLDNERYLRATLCYIDDNPVDAHLSLTPHDYPFCSAHHFRRGTWPSWLCSTWVERVVEDWTGIAGLPPGLYGSAQRHGVRPELREFLEARMRSQATRDALPLAITSRFAADWLRERAEAADGPAAWLPLAAATTVCRVCMEERALDPDWTQLVHSTTRFLWPVLEAGLLRRVACCTGVEISQRLGESESTVASRYRLHDRLVLNDPAYRERAIAITHRILRETHG